MRWLIVFLMFAIFIVRGACSGVIGGDKYVTADFVIENADYYMPDSLHVSGVVAIENNGMLETDIFVHEGATLYLENHADINSVFNLGNGAQIIQKVSDTNDMNYVVFNVPYSVFVDRANMLPWADIMDFSDGADKIILGNSVLDISGVLTNNVDNIELYGDVYLVANNVEDLYGGPFITGVSGAGNVYLVTNSTDDLFVDVAVLRGCNLYFERMRELDYEKVFNNDMGRFLNMMRINNPNDKLLNALDSAADMSSFYGIMDRSVRFNAVMLMRPLRILTALNAFENLKGDSGGMWGVLSDEFYSDGIDVTIHENVMPELEFGFRLGAGKIEYMGDYDAYRGDLFELDLFYAWNLDNNLTVSGFGGVMYQVTDIGDVFYENRVYENPDVWLWYLKSDAGYKFDLFDMFYMNVYTGVSVAAYSVEDIVGNEFNLYSGAKVGHEFELMGIKYNCSVGVDINTDTDIGMFASVGFLSDMDMLGGDAKISALRMFGVMTYKLSLGLQFLF